MEKPPRSEAASRCLRLLVKGYTDQKIFALAAKEKWIETPQQLRQAITEAQFWLMEFSEINQEAETGLAVLQYKDLYEKSEKIQDYKTALACRRALDKLIKDQGGKVAKVTGPRRFSIAK